MDKQKFEDDGFTKNWKWRVHGLLEISVGGIFLSGTPYFPPLALGGALFIADGFGEVITEKGPHYHTVKFFDYVKDKSKK